MTVDFRVLGDVTATVDGGPVEVGHARQRAVLAALLVDVNEPVHADALLDRVWADQLPRHGRTALAGYLSRLRRALTGVTIQRGPAGYTLLADPDTVDLHRFRRLVAQARAAADDATAARLFASAAQLWRGEPFATLDTPWFNDLRRALEADRLAAELDHNDAALRRGEHARLLGDLARCSARYPLDERVAAQEMTALHRSGRSAAALERYRQLRARLADELGIDPGAALRDLYRTIVAGESPPPRPLAPPRPLVPRQLPAAPQTFTGRVADIARLDAVLDREQAAAVVISSVTGTAGVGKTALAVHWSHRVAGRFPDGQLYVNLRGYDPESSPLSPAEALRDLLGALAVEPGRVPHGLQARGALYRSLLADRRMLIVLDNAREVSQVRPLLPGSSRCVVVVTSRHQMPGLIALNNAQPVELDLLTAEEAATLLRQRIGGPRITAEPDALHRLVERCARLPLALAIVAGRALLSPALPLATLASELEAALYDHDDAAIDIRAVFDCSVRALDAASATLFRLLGAHWGPDVTAPAAASLAGVPVAEARAALAVLTEASLLQEHLPGRWMMHDLLRAYARDLAQGDPEAADACARLLDHHVQSAHRADLLVYPSRDPIEPPPTAAGVTIEHFPGREAALAWFTAEHDTLIGGFAVTGDGITDPAIWQLAWTLSNVLNLQGRWHDQELAQRAAVTAARRLGDPLREAHALRALGRVQDVLTRDAEANANLDAALALFDTIGDLAGAAQTNVNLARMYARRGDLDAMLSHDEASLRLYRQSGSRAGQARALNNIAWGLGRAGRHTEALEACRESLHLCQEIGNVHGQANTALNMAHINEQRGERALATTGYARAVELFHQAHDRPQEAKCLTLLGDSCSAAGDQHRAREAWQRAATLLDELGLPAGEVHAKLARHPDAGPAHSVRVRRWR
ncbi:AfsR/SARP family transcriptional regulator [Actinoplanes sp. CA-252034]|uniref:AfsR/SARP family transcriptional regulator n=1 Tax=Actinoplanes sp. CA-252034 TaxID=3239906 RepID=UPI003D988C5C